MDHLLLYRATVGQSASSKRESRVLLSCFVTPSARFRHASSLRGLNVEENRSLGDQLGDVSEFFGGVCDAVMHTDPFPVSACHSL
ncbi:hypothetical protein ACFC0R_39670 [Streptomyces sp. NPDC056086]|uniref:hypothetical protein n=1 Tax=Streptomyces sp. NPDC056086 TaxID=3345709 RepID=UPI0035D6EF24